MEKSSLDRLRKSIDDIDSQLMTLLEERIRICKEIGKLKSNLGMPLRDENREKAILERAGEFRLIFKQIIKECVKVQEGYFK